jgi:hypothetical protein
METDTEKLLKDIRDTLHGIRNDNYIRSLQMPGWVWFLLGTLAGSIAACFYIKS